MRGCKSFWKPLTLVWPWLMWCGLITTARAAEAPSVIIVRTPDGGIQPQVQTDARGHLHMIYFAGDPQRGDIFYVRREDTSGKFSKPLRVNSQAQSVVAIGTVRGPHLALGKNDRVHVAWMGSDRAEPKAPGNKTPMLYTRLADAGDAFEAQRNLIQQHAGLDGGGAIAADADGNVYVAWHAPLSHDDEADRHVWLARSRDDGRSFAPEINVLREKTGACGCCGMNVMAASNGEVYILFRSATEMVHRDIYLLASSDHGQTFSIVDKDPLELSTCAMSTAGFARAGDDVLATWETKEQIRFARVGAKLDALPIASVPGTGGTRKHPAVAVNARGEILIAWAEHTGWNRGGFVAWQGFDQKGQPQVNRSGHAEGLPAWSEPAVAANADGTFAVYY